MDDTLDSFILNKPLTKEEAAQKPSNKEQIKNKFVVFGEFAK